MLESRAWQTSTPRRGDTRIGTEQSRAPRRWIADEHAGRAKAMGLATLFDGGLAEQRAHLAEGAAPGGNPAPGAEVGWADDEPTHGAGEPSGMATGVA